MLLYAETVECRISSPPEKERAVGLLNVRQLMSEQILWMMRTEHHLYCDVISTVADYSSDDYRQYLMQKIHVVFLFYLVDITYIRP